MKSERKPVTMLREGVILKANTFETPRGCYTIRIILHEGILYFHKMLNGNVVEVINLDKLKGDM